MLFHRPNQRPLGLESPRVSGPGLCHGRSYANAHATINPERGGVACGARGRAAARKRPKCRRRSRRQSSAGRAARCVYTCRIAGFAGPQIRPASIFLIGNPLTVAANGFGLSLRKARCGAHGALSRPCRGQDCWTSSLADKDGEDLLGTKDCPAISIVFEGGPGTIATVASATKNRIPVLLMNGSGRVANLLSDCVRVAESERFAADDEDGVVVETLDYKARHATL